MAFHGYTPEDYQYGRNSADRDKYRINEDATALELARIAAGFVRGYIGVDRLESREVVQTAQTQALEQLTAARELGLIDDMRDYDAVAAKIEQDLWVLALGDGNEYPPMTDEQKAAYKALTEPA